MNNIEMVINEALTNTNLEIRNEAIVYASNRLNYKNSKIAQITSLAVSTIRTYVKKFFYLLEKAIERFEKIIVKYLVRPTTYIIEFYADEERTKPLFLKIGKTVNLNQRLKSLKNGYKKSYNIEMVYPVVKKVYQFEEEDDALTFENELRKFYKAKKNVTYIKNDRFLNVSFDEKELKENARLNKALDFLSTVYA